MRPTASRVLNKNGKKMRNNSKLKSLLYDNNVSMSMISPDSEIEMIVTNINQNISFVVSGKNWSDVLNKALKHSNALKISAREN
jgi:hypothetical protein